jgi:hypothetical protein
MSDTKPETDTRITQYTSEYPCTGLSVQGYHGTFMLLAFLRELLGQRSLTARIRFVALLEAFSHLVTFLVRFRTEAHVVFIMLICLVLVLQVSSLVICTA